MSETPDYHVDHLLQTKIATFPSGNLYHLFATPLYAGKVANVDAIQKELEASYKKNTFEYKEEFGMTHQLSTKDFSDNIIDTENLTQFEQAIHFHLSNYLQGIQFNTNKGYVDNIQYKICQSWWSKFGYRDYAHEHNHGNTDISGVYYFKAASTDEVQQYDTPWGTQPEGNIFLSTPVPSCVTSFTFCHYANKQSQLAEVGKILLFPAHLNHSVSTNETNQDRVSLAFNIVFEKNP